MADEMPLRLRITSDGTSWGSQVQDADTGRVIPNVHSATWTCSADPASLALVTLVLQGDVEVDLVGVASKKEDESNG